MCPSDATCTVEDGVPTCVGGTAVDPMLASCVRISELSTTGAAGAGLDDFVELSNSCAASVSLAGARLLYRSAAGTSNTTLQNFPAGAVINGAGTIVLVGSAYTGPVIDGMLVTGLAGLGGGVALSHSGTIYESLGYGTATNAFIEARRGRAAQRRVDRAHQWRRHEQQRGDFTAQPRSPGMTN